jgi:uncharacterized membrane protein
VAKSISWRATGTMDTFVVSWIITGELVVALSIGGVEIVTKMILYYLHERLWDRVSWGRLRSGPVDYEI